MPWPFEHACIINLDSRPDRWLRTEANLKRLGVSAQRFPAVAFPQLGDDQPPLELKKFLQEVDGERKDSERKLLATWACMRSHLAVIATAKTNGWPQVLVLEDDCLFEPYSVNVLNRVARQLRDQNWDMLYLGGTIKKGSSKLRVSPNLLRVTRVRLAHAYIVKSSMYDRILCEAPRSGLPIDWYYSERLSPQIKSLFVTPLLARQALNDMSDIEQVVRKPKLKTRQFLQRLWAGLRYKGWPS
ncbi:glycosyltransferase family 25 protein [Stutzerimonas sp. VN223-3]|uniref:glycosyltransferase family 25 protein n=1 Tax=Stutzerimonas sp. VN223-3 TaxID=3384601 RepID=UPI0038B59863